MEIEQNTISWDWTVTYEGRRFFVNVTESDGQTLSLCNRDNWDIEGETEDGIEEFDAGVFSDDSPKEQAKAQENADMIDKLIAYCIRKWDNAFVKELREDLKEQRRRLEGQGIGGPPANPRQFGRPGEEREAPALLMRERKRDYTRGRVDVVVPASLFGWRN